MERARQLGLRNIAYNSDHHIIEADGNDLIAPKMLTYHLAIKGYTADESGSTLTIWKPKNTLVEKGLRV